MLCISSALKQKMSGDEQQHAERHIRPEREDGTGRRAEASSNFERDPPIPGKIVKYSLGKGRIKRRTANVFGSCATKIRLYTE